MAKELQAQADTGLDLYAILISAVGTYWNGSELEAYDAPSWTDYDIALTEDGAGLYFGDMPAAEQGVYSYVVYEMAGATPATTDTIKGSGSLPWSGTSEIIPNALVTLADDAITSDKFDESTAYPVTAEDNGDTSLARSGTWIGETPAAITIYDLYMVLLGVRTRGYSDGTNYYDYFVGTIPSDASGTSFVDITLTLDDDTYNGGILLTQSGWYAHITDWTFSTNTLILDKSIPASQQSIPYIIIPAFSAGGGLVELVDGSITASSFDGTTAFPVTKADTGATEIARTGADADTLEVLSDEIDAVSAQISGIGSGTGAAMNFAAVTDSGTTSPLNGVTAVGTRGTNDYTKTAADNAVYEIITSNGSSNIDWVYKYTVGSGRVGVKATFNGYLLVGSPVGTKVINCYAYNWTGTPAWDLVSVIAGQTGTTDITRDITLLAAHTGTGANAGVIYIRFTNAGAVTSLNVDQLTVQAQNLGQTAGYADGAIWVGGSNANTTPYVDGTADNPVTWAAALTLAAAVGLTRFRIRNGETITLDATLSAKSLIGRNWSLVLAAQSISGSYFEGAQSVTGASTGANPPTFVDCRFGAATIPPAVLLRCGIGIGGATYAAAAKGTFTFTDCYSLGGGVTPPTFTFSGLGASSSINFRRWDGGATMTFDGDCTAAVNVVSGGVQTITPGGGTVKIRGVFEEVDLVMSAGSSVEIVGIVGPVAISGANGTVAITGVSGTVTNTSSPTATITQTQVNLATINTQADLALTDYDPPTNTEMEARTLPAENYFDPAADAVENVNMVNGLAGDTITAGAIHADAITEIQSGLATSTEISALNNLSAEDVWRYVIETLTAEEILQITLAVLAGKSEGGGTATIHFRNYADTLNRVAATVDANGNRTAIVLYPPAAEPPA
jgi:hypothetical protein